MPESAATTGASEDVEEYPLHQGDWEVSEAPSAYVKVVCSVCYTRMHATEDQVGQTMVCPDCDTPVLVPPLSEAPKEPQQPDVTFEHVGEYGVYEGQGQPPPSDRLVHQVYIPVVCPLCHTRMHATEDQVGREIVCSDCQTPVVVPPPPQAPKKVQRPAVAFEGTEEYDVREDGWQPPAADRSVEQAEIPVVCPLCHTRMHATEKQVGQKIFCPDCGTPAVVPPPETLRPKPEDLVDESVGEYGVDKPSERPKLKPATGFHRAQVTSADSTDTAAGEPARRPQPAYSGAFRFLWHPDTWPRWVGLSLLAIGIHYVLAWALGASQGPAASLAQAVALGIAGVFAACWSIVASAFCLAIIEDTSDGNDQIENWPEAVWVAWITDFFFVFNSVCVSVLPALVVARPLLGPGQAADLVVAAVLFAAFPVFLLSMLQDNSVFSPISLPVMQSWLTAWWAWLLFYVQAVILLGVSLWFVSLCLDFSQGLAIIVTGPVLVTTLMIYSRLLGRLGWHCGEASRREETDDAENGQTT